MVRRLEDLLAPLGLEPVELEEEDREGDADHGREAGKGMRHDQELRVERRLAREREAVVDALDRQGVLREVGVGPEPPAAGGAPLERRRVPVRVCDQGVADRRRETERRKAPETREVRRVAARLEGPRRRDHHRRQRDEDDPAPVHDAPLRRRVRLAIAQREPVRVSVVPGVGPRVEGLRPVLLDMARGPLRQSAALPRRLRAAAAAAHVDGFCGSSSP